MLQEPFSRCCPKALAGNVGTRLSACWKRMWPGLEKHSGLKFIIFPLFRQEDLVELLFIPSEGNNWGWAKVLLTRLLGSNGGTAQSPKHCDYTVGFTILRTLPGRIILRQFLRWGYAPFPFWFGHVSIPGITINHWVFVGRSQGSREEMLQKSRIPHCIWQRCQLGQKDAAYMVGMAETSQGASLVMLSPQDPQENKHPWGAYFSKYFLVS